MATVALVAVGAAWFAVSARDATPAANAAGLAPVPGAPASPAPPSSPAPAATLEPASTPSAPATTPTARSAGKNSTGKNESGSSGKRKVRASGSCGASYYAEGQLTANGERFDPSALTAAHKTLSFGSRVRVTNSATGRSVIVRINDRGPFIGGRCLDLSRAAFTAIGNTAAGVLRVRYEVLAA